MNIAFRPHHFLCALCFQGKGYSPQFIAHFTEITNALRSDDKIAIYITEATDSICEPCPSRRAAQCLQQAKIQKLDQAHAAILQLQPGTTITWKEAKNRIKTNMSLQHFHEACAPCEWKKLGICEAVLSSGPATSAGQESEG